MTTVGEARRAAARWIARHGRTTPAYLGAYVSGSTVALSAEAEMPATSDLDVVVVSGLPEPPPKIGKIRYEGMLLEITSRTPNSPPPSTC